jgi:hypothetical protein
MKTKLIKWTQWLLIISVMMSLIGINQACRRGLKDSETALIGVITDVQNQVPVGKVQLEVRNTSTGKIFKGSSDQQGRFKIFTEAGYYELKAEHPKFHSYSRNIVLGKGTNQEDFYMSPILEKPGSFEGEIIAEDTKKPLENVTVQIGTNLAKTDAKGRFKFDALPLGSYPVWATTPGYQAVNETVTIVRGANKVKYTLKRLDMADVAKPAEHLPRNPVYVIDSTFLGDFRAHSVRTIQPMNERHEYTLISESRHRRHLNYNEHVDKGEVLYVDDAIYIKFLGKWQVPEQINTSSRPDAFIADDILMVSHFFNFADKDFEIKELGSEKMNGYNTKKYQLSYKATATPEKHIDVQLWMIYDESNPRIHRMITRIKGRVPEVLNIDTWAEIDTNITHINQGNKIEIPSIHKAS